MSISGDYKRYTIDIGFVAIAQIVVALLYFLRLPVLTKILGASLYGTWSLILTPISLITPLAMLGLGMAIVRFLAAERDTSRIREEFLSAVFIIFAASTIASLILILCSSLFASSVLGDVGRSDLVKLAAFMILTQSLSQISIAFFRTFRQMKFYSVLLAAKAAVELGLMALFLHLGWELTGLVIALLIGGLMSTIMALSVVIKQIGFRIPRFSNMKDYLRYGIPLMPNDAIVWIIFFSNRYIIGYFLQLGDVGIYVAACAVANIIFRLIGPVVAVLFPAISQSYDNNDIIKTQNYFKYSLKYLMMISIPSAFGLSVLAVPLLQVFTTSAFISGSTVIPFIAFGLVIFSFHRIGSYIFHLVKKTYLLVILLSVSAILNIGLNLLLIPRMGILGAAIASFIAYVVLGISTIVIAFRYFNFDLGFSFIGKSILSSSIMALVIWLIAPSEISKIIISILLGAAIYFAIIFVLKGITKRELSLIKESLAEFRRK